MFKELSTLVQREMVDRRTFWELGVVSSKSHNLNNTLNFFLLMCWWDGYNDGCSFNVCPLFRIFEHLGQRVIFTMSIEPTCIHAITTGLHWVVFVHHCVTWRRPPRSKPVSVLLFCKQPCFEWSLFNLIRAFSFLLQAWVPEFLFFFFLMCWSFSSRAPAFYLGLINSIQHKDSPFFHKTSLLMTVYS